MTRTDKAFAGVVVIIALAGGYLSGNWIAAMVLVLAANLIITAWREQGWATSYRISHAG